MMGTKVNENTDWKRAMYSRLNWLYCHIFYSILQVGKYAFSKYT